ncbi:MAG: phosphate ABC transporter permease PstA [Methanobrevibacter sp.]|uniref:phosphate ABC transporter permease PstA n=1 Tax=Methanobrevibacter sp. TaxID=66852 RepID=UPI0025E456EE|nr:phosphate ABC transporter permease PstA [Methanobrevibacter sp.]MBQ8017973.1 phosphate ABC transporter permease PstA [Methanobrevibacter sp.]
MHVKSIQKITSFWFKLSGAITLAILMIIVSYILIKGIGAINLEFLLTKPVDSGREGGILPMILSSLYLLAVTSFIAIPLGVGSALYMAEYNKNPRLEVVIRFISQVLASVPSIVFGLFGLAFLIFFLKTGWSLLSGGVILSLMSMPTIYQVSEVALKSVPEHYKEGCYGMGATKWQCITSIILPTAASGIFTGIILALTRAFSEAAAVMYLVGSSLEMPTSLLDTGRPLPLHLYVLATEGISMENAYGTAFVLIAIVLTITILSNHIISKYEIKLGV